MAVTSGYQHYQCDRCGKEAYLAEGSAEASTWTTVNRVSVDKATSAQPLTSYTMCATCRDDYIAFDRPQDDSFAAFMAQPARERAQKQANADAAKAQADQQAKAQRQQEIDAAVNAQKQADAQETQKLNDEIDRLRTALGAARDENVKLKSDAAKQGDQGKQGDKSSDGTGTPAAPAKPDDGKTGESEDDGKKPDADATGAGTAGTQGDPGTPKDGDKNDNGNTDGKSEESE